jgi:ketosteroid isomerase-like protein
MSPAETFRAYLDCFTSADLDGVAELLTEDFSFEGPMLQVNSRQAFLDGTTQLLPIVRGYEMRRQWVEGDEVCSIYDFEIETPAGAGSIPMAEWNTIRDGKLASARLLFDTAAMAALMPSD